jgi:hypothetical protein
MYLLNVLQMQWKRLRLWSGRHCYTACRGMLLMSLMLLMLLMLLMSHISLMLLMSCYSLLLAAQHSVNALHRDYNQLHANPALAQMVGFEKPILHGLCSLGACAHAVLKTFCDYDAKKFKSINVRFSR